MNSFILDTRADGHVCNNRERFIDFKEAIDKEFVATSIEYLVIKE